jgi:tRNA(fMet)-specific endonuclease VapC
MKYLLDTDACIFLIKRISPKLLKRLQRERVGAVGISSITLAELRFGVSNSARREQNEAALLRFLMPLNIEPFDQQAGAVYGNVRAALQRRGKPIGPLDTLIGAHALALGAVLVTNNIREFKRIPGLSVERWS